MSKVPKEIREALKKEAYEWEDAARRETAQQIEETLEGAELFKATRLPRRPVSVRLDPRDISMLKRVARHKGIPYSQLVAIWVHERIEKERQVSTD
ncbi:hypothetical protein HKBW3S42_00626 [Candidatus Hakubella thermalkaliphila]|uniref:CopG antitoxin of type II toxin-antitoxin system n=1 Tax=Candidatus Hakubella thermalkaliphila TaxID=2754717 RepID=A0A6V8PJL0_9ACTN|nr:hypothetical protein HKBW3S42_00626 [Candidatus Hakubella thermalkaliphila]